MYKSLGALQPKGLNWVATICYDYTLDKFEDTNEFQKRTIEERQTMQWPKERKRTNNNIQNTTQKTKDPAIRTN
jgi:hypothetical protein